MALERFEAITSVVCPRVDAISVPREGAIEGDILYGLWRLRQSVGESNRDRGIIHKTESRLVLRRSESHNCATVDTRRGGASTDLSPHATRLHEMQSL
jgi:hypothetical protein